MRVKKANRFIYFLLRCIFKPVLYLKYRFKFDRSTAKKLRPPCIIISNHVTFADQFIIGSGFRMPMNFVASDSLFRNGILSKLMKLIARPIPIAKGTADPSTVRNMMSVIRSGGSVALFPEGNRTFFGETSNINPAIAKFIKKMKITLVIVNIRGGFNTLPRWKTKVSKGKMDAYVRRVVTPEELEALSDTEIFGIIEEGLYFNEFEYNAVKRISFKGKRRAERLESVLFHCPSCGSANALRSEGNDFFCTACDARVRLDEYGFFEKVNNADMLPSNILEWSRLQERAIDALDLSAAKEQPLFCDEVIFYAYERAKKNQFIAEGEIKQFDDRFEVCGTRFYFADIADMSLQGVQKLQIYMSDGKKYLVKSKDAGTNFIKYLAIAYRNKSLMSDRGKNYYGY